MSPSPLKPKTITVDACIGTEEEEISQQVPQVDVVFVQEDKHGAAWQPPQPPSLRHVESSLVIEEEAEEEYVDRDESDYEDRMADVGGREVNEEVGRPLVRKVLKSLRRHDFQTFKGLIEQNPKLLWVRHVVGETPFTWLFGLDDEWKEYGREWAVRDPSLIMQRYTGTNMKGENVVSLSILNRDFTSLKLLVSLRPEALFMPPKEGAAFQFHPLGRIGDRPMFIAVATDQPDVVTFLADQGVSLLERTIDENN
eukprot:PhF_6_TR43154/c1_g2_i1/m.66071